MKFKVASEKYFSFAKKTIKHRTYLHYILLYKTHLSCVFGEKKITSIHEKDIDAFITTKQHLSSNSLKLILCVLKNIFNFARNELHIKINLTIKHKIKTVKKEVEPLSKIDQQKLEKYILDNKLYYNYGVLIALYTGLRIGELLALTWQDIDFIRKTISVNKTVYTITENNKSVVLLDKPKTEDSERVIPLPTSLFGLFKELQEVQNYNSNYVISNIGKQTKVRVYQKSFENLLKKLNIKHYGFHSLRHTFATRAIECGCDVKSLSKILGHSDTTITLNTYVFATMELKNRLIEKVGKTLNIKLAKHLT